jgi:hypothetical protein
MTPNLLRGTSEQLAAQEKVLRERGFAVGTLNNQPYLLSEDLLNDAIRVFWETKTPGWWNYRRELVHVLGVCTNEEFDAAFPLHDE